MTFNDRKRCWIVVRTASEIDPRTGVGLRVDAQLDTLRRYASDQGWEIVGETRDPGVSGSAQNRPGLVSLMEIAAFRPKQFDILLVESLSRLSRDAATVAAIQRRLKHVGIELCAIDMGVCILAGPESFSAPHSAPDAGGDHSLMLHEDKAEIVRHAFAFAAFYADRT